MEKEKRQRLLWILFGLFLLIQHRFVFMHYDDWGYAGLSYGYLGNAHGRYWNALDLLGFLKWHYLNWGGRVLWFAVEALALRCGEWCIQILQAIVLFFIFRAMYLLVRRRKNDAAAALLCICMYGMFRLETVNCGVFWYTASVLYVWPFSCLFGGIYIMEYSQPIGWKRKVAAAGMLFMAGFSQEQVAVLTVVYVAVSAGIRVREKRWQARQWLYGFGLLGAAIELLAPGNYVRSEGTRDAEQSGVGFLENVRTQLPEVVRGNLENRFLVFLLLVILLLTCLCGLKKHVSDRRLRCVIGAMNPVSAAALLCTFAAGEENGAAVLWIRIVFLVLLCVQLTGYLLRERQYVFLGLFAGAVCSQGMMLAAPYMVERCTLPFQSVVQVIAAYMILQCAGEFRRIAFVLTAVTAAVAAVNLTYITAGYARNAQVNRINRCRLEEKAARMDAGAPAGSLILYRLPDDRFTSQMPYQLNFIEAWMRCYYEMPQEMNFIWQQLNGYEYEYETVREERPEIASVWPDRIDAEFERTEDGGIHIAVSPTQMDSHLCIVVNDVEMECVRSDACLTTHVPPEMLEKDLHIRLLDTETGLYSDEVTLNVESDNHHSGL